MFVYSLFFDSSIFAFKFCFVIDLYSLRVWSACRRKIDIHKNKSIWKDYVTDCMVQFKV